MDFAYNHGVRARGVCAERETMIGKQSQSMRNIVYSHNKTIYNFAVEHIFFLVLPHA